MHHRREIMQAALAGAAILSGCATPRGADTAVESRLRETVGARDDVGLIAVVVDRLGARTSAYGSSGAEGVALDGDAVFEIMSITKVLTALLLSDMVGRGEVAFDDPANSYLPPALALRTRGRPITLLDLATYRSGLPNMPGNLPPNWYAKPDPLGDYTQGQLSAFLMDHVPDHEPGAHYRYANLGFGVLGHALANRAGTSYEALLIDRVCRPLGMNRTRIELTAEMRTHLVQGHDLDLRPTPIWNFPGLPGAGTVRTDARDLTLFLKACMGLRRTPLQAALARLHAIRRPTNMPETQAGLGWFITSDADDELVWKSGLSGGCNTFIGFSTRTGRGALVFSNFLWRPLDTAVINLGLELIDPDFRPRDFGPLNSSA